MRPFLNVLAVVFIFFSFAVGSGPADARARLVAVFPIRSTPELSTQATSATQQLIDEIDRADGFEARAVSAPRTGTLGEAASTVGAEFYVVGQIVSEDAGAVGVTVGTFKSATDASVAEYHTELAARGELHVTPDAIGLSAKDPTSSAALDGTLVPAGSPVSVTVDAPLSSSSAKIGDAFTFKCAAAVVVDGFIVINKGAEGQGRVTVAEHSGGNGHAGKLGVQFDWISAVDGNKIALAASPRSEDGEEKKGASSTATIASYLVLGPLGLFAHNFVHGRDVTLDDSKVMNAYVDHSVHVVSQLHDLSPPGYAR